MRACCNLPIARTVSFLGALLIGAPLSLVHGPLAFAGSELPSCKQCQYADCVRDMIKRNEGLIEFYKGLQREYAPGWLKNGKAIDVVNFSEIQEGDRSRTWLTLYDDLKTFMKSVAEESGGVPPATACAFKDKLEVDTDSLETCAIGPQLAAVEKQMPCGELAESVRSHEQFHQQACKNRQIPSTGYWLYTATDTAIGPVSKYYPPNILTPHGLAKEEMAAYGAQNVFLRQLLKEAEAQCRHYKFDTVSVTCNIPGKDRRVWSYSISGEVCGDPKSERWQFQSSGFVEAGGRKFPWQVPASTGGGCSARDNIATQYLLKQYQAAGAGGFVCFFDDSQTPSVELHFILPRVCSEGGEKVIKRATQVGAQCTNSKPDRPHSEKPIS